MKRIKGKKPKRPEFEGKSRDYHDGYEMVEEYFNHILEGGNNFGSAPFRIFVEAVAGSIRDREKIGQHAVALIDEVIESKTGVGKNAMPEV